MSWLFVVNASSLCLLGEAKLNGCVNFFIALLKLIFEPQEFRQVKFELQHIIADVFFLLRFVYKIWEGSFALQLLFGLCVIVSLLLWWPHCKLNFTDSLANTNGNKSNCTTVQTRLCYLSLYSMYLNCLLHFSKICENLNNIVFCQKT